MNPINKSTLDELKIKKIKGITNSRYIVKIQIPKIWIKNPVEGTGLAATFFLQEDLKNSAFYAANNSIDKVNENTVVLSFEVSEPYLYKFYRALINLPNEAELQIN
jgi:hypothetical protein